MSVQTLTTIRLGYGGYGVLNGTVVPLTSGSMENSVSVQHMSGYSMPITGDSRSRILHSDGTVTHTGNISFDLTGSALSKVKTLLTRSATFNVGIYDGEHGMTMTNCKVTSISLNGSPSGFITGNVVFMSDFPAAKTSNNNTNSYRDAFIEDIIPYWWSGQSYVRDWSFTFTQTVIPKFCNRNYYRMINEGILASSPNYLFVGETEANLDFTTYCPLVADNVSIANSTFRINGRTTGTGYTVGGFNEIGTYKYSIASHAQGSNDNDSIIIT